METESDRTHVTLAERPSAAEGRPAGGPTPYAQVNAILAVLLNGTRAALGRNFVGLYLYGSLAGGGFDPESSDIDFLVATNEEVSSGILPDLEAMHARIAASKLPWSDHLEGSYIGREALRRYDPANSRHPTIGVDWPFKVDYHGADWVLNRYVIRERGLVLAGPSPEALIGPISPGDLRAAVIELLTGRWASDLALADWLAERYYQAFAVLTMCRALCLLATGKLVSKPEAVAWAEGNLSPRWTSLVARAMHWRHVHEHGDPGETLAFIRYTVDVARVAAGGDARP